MSPESQVIGAGLNVFESDEVVEAPVRWLASPQDVITFVTSGEAERSIAISRGGTTTFMAPALAAGVLGLITLAGAPESHLGILSREFRVPCVMSVKFTQGVETDRGEIVPADGTIVRLEVASRPTGYVLEVSA